MASFPSQRSERSKSPVGLAARPKASLGDYVDEATLQVALAENVFPSDRRRLLGFRRKARIMSIRGRRAQVMLRKANEEHSAALLSLQRRCNHSACLVIRLFAVGAAGGL
jgi:hypothetical protein